MSEQTAWALLPDISTTIQAIVWAEDAYMYLEQVPQRFIDGQARQAGLCLKRYDAHTTFETWQRGRVFDAQHEIKWEWQGSKFHVVYCGSTTPANLTPYPLPAVDQRLEYYYTWGQRVRSEDYELLGLNPEVPAFIELQIPRILYYPVAQTARRVQVSVKEFYGTNGHLCYARWCGLREDPA